MDVQAYLKERKDWIESALTRSIQDESMPSELRKSMRYSLDAGGKRLRPVLVFAGAECVGGTADEVMPAAIALEMIHTFSLIHDDLPAMDDDDLRRGKPTNHKVFGEAMAILAGDGLLSEAFYVLSEARGCDVAARLRLIREISQATGGRGMVGGQVIDMLSEGKKIDEAALQKLHAYKTGALLKVSVTSGAMMCGASDAQIASLARYGEAIGLAFQIADDILDIEGDQELLGKDVGSDVDNEKSTYPSIIGLEASKRKAKALVDGAVDALSEFGEKAEPLRLIARYIIERDR